MTYSKPEIAVLGEANRVVQGGKTLNPEDTDSDIFVHPSFELED